MTDGRTKAQNKFQHTTVFRYSNLWHKISYQKGVTLTRFNWRDSDIEVTPWRRAFLDKLTVAQLIKTLYTFNETRRFKTRGVQIPGIWSPGQLNFVWWPLILSALITVTFLPIYKNLYQFTRTAHKTPDESEVHRSLKNCGSSAWNVLPVNILAPRIWTWHLECSKNLCTLFSAVLTRGCQSQMAAIHFQTSYSFKMHFNIILESTPTFYN
jgi:hypothetical protein